MCGIIYQHNFDGTSTSNRVLKQLKRQKHRGMESFGFALPDRHVMNWKIKYEDIARALRRTENPEVLFHHRLSTSTENRPTACHPFSTKDWFDTEFVGVHNGMLRNEHHLYEEHKERFPGLRYVSDNGKDFNDSEAYIFDLASYFSGLIEGIQMTGYGAFVVIEFDKETHERIRLHWGTTNKTSSPLRVHWTEKHLDITSEGKGWLVEQDMHYVYDYATGEISSSPLVHDALPYMSKYDPYYSQGYSGGYRSTTTSKTTTVQSHLPYTDYEDDYYDEEWYRKYYGASDSTDTSEAIIGEVIDGDSDEVPLWSDDDFLLEPFEHKGETMYRDGCCQYCDQRMEFFGDFSPLTTKAEPDVKLAPPDADTQKLISAILARSGEKKEPVTV